MQTFWLALLGLLLSGYFVLGGYDLGVQMLHPFMKDRDAALGAMAPFFLGNEVWLVAFAGVLFGAFPHLEGSMLPGLYPLVVAILAGLVVGNTAVQLRRRTRRGRRWWQALIVAGGALPAVCWGLVVGSLLHGVPRRADGGFHIGTADVFTPFVLVCGVGVALLFAAHGAAFLALRSAPDQTDRAGTTLLAAAGGAAVLALVLTLLGVGASIPIRSPRRCWAGCWAWRWRPPGGRCRAGTASAPSPPPAVRRSRRCCWSGSVTTRTCWPPKPGRA